MRLRARRILYLGFATMATAVAVLASEPVWGADPVGPIHGSGTVDVVADSYVVLLNNTPALRTNGVEATAHGLADQYGGKVGRTYSHALHGFEVSMSAARAARLAANPAVAYVQRNGIYTASATQPDPPAWGLDRIDQRGLPLDHAYTYPTTAANVHVYVIDTGIRFTHTTFGGRASAGFDAITSGGTATDCNGHGTHVAGTIGGNEYGVAKGVSLVAVRVLDCDGSGTTAQVAAGVDWVTANAVKPAVANMSLGGPTSTLLDSAVTNSIAAGVTYVIAAGNNGGNACGFSPSRVPAAITVGASNMSDARPRFSNSGTCLDLFAPGVNITSSWNANDTATMLLSGTSMASPHVAGAAALIASANPTFTPQQVRDALVADATNGVITNAGTGSPNRLLFVPNTAAPADFSMAVSPTSAAITVGGSATATVTTAVTSGAAQPVSLSAIGAPSGSTVTFTPTPVTAGGSATLTIATSASTPPGVYPLTITGTGPTATHTASYTLTVTAPSGGGCSGTNATDTPIQDKGPAVFSPLVISGCNRNGSSASTVEVHIVHTYRGDLVIDLVAPSGTAYRLKNSDVFDGTDNVDATYPVNLAAEPANGTWLLKVQDMFTGDTGFVNSWTLTL
jgi:subtilisin family serine protease